MPGTVPNFGSILTLQQRRPFMAAGSAQSANGTVTRKFTKEIIKTGTYINPVDGAKFTVTEADLERWALVFSQMNANGVRVPMPDGHTEAPEATRGYVLDMFKAGDTLCAVCEMIGPDAIALAERNDVSVYVPPSYTDGKGNVYDRPIKHVAITAYPVVSGLNKFVPLAASQLGITTPVPVMQLAQIGAPTMETLKKIAAALGIDPGTMDETQLGDAIVAKATAMATEMSNAKTEADKAAAALAASNAAPDPATLEVIGENRALKFTALENAGHITPAVAKELTAAFATGNGLALSMKPGVSELFKAVVSALSKNTPKDLATAATRINSAIALANPGANQKAAAVTTEEITATAKRLYGRTPNRK